MCDVEPVISEEGEGDSVVVAEEASLFPPPGLAALTPFIELLDGGTGDIDVDTMAAAPPTGEAPAPGGFEPDEAADPNPPGGGGVGAAPPPAA